MWQEVALQKQNVKQWKKILRTDLVKPPLQNDCLTFDTSITRSCPTPVGSSRSSLLPDLTYLLAASSQVVQASPSRRSEESCISLSECTESLSRNFSNSNDLSQKRFTKMSNPVTSPAAHNLMDDDPETTSAPNPTNSWWTSMLLSATQSQPPTSANAIAELDNLNWSSDLATPVSNCELVEQLSNSIAISSTTPSIAADCHPHICMGSNRILDSPLSMGSCSFSGVTDSSVWSQVLLGSEGSEALQNFHNFPGEGLQDVLYSRQLRQNNEFILSEPVKKIEDMPAWEHPLKSFTFQGDDMNLATLKNPSATLQYSQLIDTDRLSSTICTPSHIETMSASRDHCSAVPQSASINTFTSGPELRNTAQFDRSRVKQEYPATYDSSICGTSGPFWIQTGFGVETYRDDAPSSRLNSGNRSLFRTFASDSNFAPPSTCDDFPPGRWPGIHSSRFLSILPYNLPPSPHVSKQSAPMLSLGNKLSRQINELSGLRSDLKPPLQGSATDRTSSLQYSQHTIEAKPLMQDYVLSNLRSTGHMDDAKDGTVPDAKRGVASLNTSESSSEGVFKRPRVEQAPHNPPLKPQVRKEKLGDRITALQQLVSPFGKTDTASVLMEAICYIKFLHDQVQVLSTPYMKTASTKSAQNDPGKKLWSSDKSQDLEEPKLDLRSRGLCLVPVSCTLNVANENGGDYWAPSLGGGYR